MLPIAFTIALLACTVAIVVHMVWLGRQTVPDGPGEQPESQEAARAFLLWNALYVNPADPRGWLPKPVGIGYTVNFRTRGHATLFAVLVGLDLACALGLSISALTLA